MPDYPGDLREGFKDNGYCADDSVTIVGWMKDMPAEAWEKGRSGNITQQHLLYGQTGILCGSHGGSDRAFPVRVPLVNTSETAST